MDPIKRPVRSKKGQLFEPVQLNRKKPRSSETCRAQRRSERLQEKNVNRKVDYSSISLRQSLKKAKIHENRTQGQLQPKNKRPQTQKSKKRCSTKRKGRNQPKPLSTSGQAQIKPPQTRDTQASTQRDKGNPIENWLNTLPFSLESLVDPLLPKKSEEMPPSAKSFLHKGQTSIGITQGTQTNARVQGINFKESLAYRNIYINRTVASSELVKRANKIIKTERSTSELDNAIAQELALVALNLDTGTEEDLVQQLCSELIPAMRKVPHQSLKTSANKWWLNAVEAPLGPGFLTIPPPLPKPKPDLVFGYSETAFNREQLSAIDLLVDQLQRNYAMPDGKVRFPFFVVEFKSQASGGSHLIATNQLTNAGAIAMEGTLQLARRISSEENLDLDEPQLFSLSIDHMVALVNVHWLSKNAESGAFCFHTNLLSRYHLDANGLKAIHRAVKNILDYGADRRLQKIRGELDTYVQKEMAIQKDNLPSEPPSEEQRPQTRSRRRKNAHSLANQSRGLRRKRARPAPDKEEEEEEEEEGANSPASKKLRIQQERITSTGKDNPLIRQQQATQNRKAPFASKPVRVSSRLAAQA